MTDTTNSSNETPDNGPALAAIIGEVKANIERASVNGLDSLKAFRDIGRGLIEAKDLIGTKPKGAFGAWCDANFPFSKEWRARLMRLAGEWPIVNASLAWAEREMKRTLGRKEYSVDGALALAAEFVKWAANLSPEDAADLKAAISGLAERIAEIHAKGSGEGSDEGSGEGSGEGSKKESPTEKLRRELAEALERIKALEAELAKSKGGRSRAKPDAEQGPTDQGPAVDGATKARAGKVYAMARRGENGTLGEREAAREKLAKMAEKSGFKDVPAFLEACGLDAREYILDHEADRAEREAARDAA
jgi:hypothetical protein